MIEKDFKRVDRWEVGGENVTFYDEKGEEVGVVPLDSIIGLWLDRAKYDESVRQRIISASKKMGKVV